MNKLIPIIGLEVHIELKTKSKMFCGCSADHFSKPANIQTCPVCLGLPGALPYANEKAIEDVLLMGNALNCQVRNFSKFDRKHYFYPDLPKAFQTSQYDLPFCFEGNWKSIDEKKVGIRRVHLEEDTAKLVHEKVNGKICSLIDFNRSGVPLMEIVTDPDFHDLKTVDNFLKDVQLIVRYLGISDAEMQKGSMRLEANISLTEEVDGKYELPDYKIELKNINSFRFLLDAIGYELERQEELLIANKKINQETRGYNEKSQTTYSQRSKEEAMDYRYFPEPDLPPITFDEIYLKKLQENMPVLPVVIRKRLKDSYDFPDNILDFLVSDKTSVVYFEKAIILSDKFNIGAKTIANMIVNQKAIAQYPEPELLIKKLLEVVKKDFASAPVTEDVVKSVISEEEKAVTDYKNGKTLGYLIGMAQKKLKGKGDLKILTETIIKYLKK